MLAPMSAAALLSMLMQVGPNPNAGALPGTPDELLDRPAREEAVATDPMSRSPESEWLARCLAAVEDDPARAHTLAQIERNAKSGAERIIANHCLGLAATELERWDEARQAFIAARDETPADERRARARFGTMAGNAALASGDAIGALALLGTAGDDARAAASATLEAISAIDTARAMVALDKPADALIALELATRLEPARPEGWLLRATLLRRFNRLDEAQDAIERAAALDTGNPATGLEAGIIAVLSGREEAARASWESVLSLDPEGPVGSAARNYLAQLGPAPESTDAREAS